MKNPFPEWKHEDPEGSLTAIYEWTVRNAEILIGWYAKKSRPKRIFAQGLLGSAVFLGGLGLLCPLMDAACKNCGVNLLDCSISFSQLGYLVIALAGIILLYDRTYGLSSGWMRFIETQLKLEQSLKDFRLAWVQAVAVQVPEESREEYLQRLLTLLRDFTATVEKQVVDETNVWICEFRRSITGINDLVSKK